jgi:hypothetical protein
VRGEREVKLEETCEGNCQSRMWGNVEDM